MQKKQFHLSLAALALMVATGAQAQEKELQRCAEIEDSLERLVCYDNITKEKQQKNSAKQKKKAENHGRDVAEKARQKGQSMRDRKQQTADDRFGMEHKKSEEEEEIEKIQVEIESKRQDAYDNWVLTLANGQIWKQTESVTYFPWNDEDTYYIEKGAFNSFYFGREGINRRFRVERIK
ncbi:type VI secretion system-associated protein TagO [Idiomarina seosinensis]|uniref:Uncharacterized protein n=1 Tax=Idiomarina seosinensis TaxID=281739 RepID=A0A432Z756_9GAMM|nr:type VI secretion system-associated protein TagO [Idiomarina seosinensis]RUO73717.1 hypothetical protein CWI81_11890 [Idiomarina seosinensis]